MEVALITTVGYEGKVLDIVIDGQSYQLGSASGAGCNCLIDTLRQKLPGVICSVSGVRAALEERHRSLPTRIDPGTYLPLDFWDEIVDLCGFHNRVRAIRTSWAHRFRIVLVDLTWIGHGEVFPRGSRPGLERSTLTIARVNQNHFVPLFRAH